MLLGIAQSDHVFEVLSAGVVARAGGFDGLSFVPLGLQRATIAGQSRAFVFVTGLHGVGEASPLDGFLQSSCTAGASSGTRGCGAPHGLQDLDGPQQRRAGEDGRKDDDADPAAEQTPPTERRERRARATSHPSALCRNDDRPSNPSLTSAAAYSILVSQEFETSETRR